METTWQRENWNNLETEFWNVGWTGFPQRRIETDVQVLLGHSLQHQRLALDFDDIVQMELQLPQ